MPQDANGLVAIFRKKCPDLTAEEETAIRRHAETDCGLFFRCGFDLPKIGKDDPENDGPAKQIRDLCSALTADRIAFEEITDLEDREGITDAQFAEQVIALAHRRLNALRAIV